MKPHSPYFLFFSFVISFPHKMVVACSQWIGEIRLLFFITFGILGTKFLSHFIAAARLKSSNYAKYQDDDHPLHKISIYGPKKIVF